MSYQVLARKWRPRSFSEMAGQTHVLKTLINSLENNRLHHAYLFTGTRGVGKTTIARILARCLNCETGVTATPCGNCGACREIDEGRFIDLIEVDAASRTKVEDTRELLENVQYSPTRGRYKVYLIDEVHMLSVNSFNALLKTLEEPPPHVKFLLATTDPQKLPVTVLSRCLQFNLKNLSPEQLVEHLTHILKAEDIPFEDAALWQLGRAAKGSVRDSLTLLDQAIAFCNGRVNEAEVSALLGTIDQAIVQHLVDALIARDGMALLDVIRGASEHGADFGAVLEELLSYLHRVAVAQVVPDGIDNSQGDREAVIAHARAVPAEVIQLYYQVALKGREDLPLALDARSGLEMSLLRMLAFTPKGMPESPGDALANGQAAVSSSADEQVKKKPESRVDPSARTSTEPAPGRPVVDTKPADMTPRSLHVIKVEAVREASGSSDQAGADASSDSKESVLLQPQSSGVVQESAEATGNSDLPDRDEPVLALDSLAPEHWVALFGQLDLGGITGNMLANALLEKVEADHLSFILDEAQASLLNDTHRKRIAQALGRYFGRELKITLTPGPVTGAERETPARWRRRREAERQARAVESFQSDTAVQEILQRFSGAIVPDSIEPLTPRNY